MKNDFYNSKQTVYFVPAFFLFFYLLLPTQNSTVDALNYAADIKWNIMLFSSHHLLYNAFGYVLYHFCQHLGWEIAALPLMKIANAIFAALNLIVLNKILVLLTTSLSKRISLLFFVGSSFAVMRFATENETYVIPIFFSLIANFYLIKYLNGSPKSSYVVISGVWAAMACLFHQIHFFWWLGILISFLLFTENNRSKLFTYYVLTALIVPIIYLVVIKFYTHQSLSIENITHYVFRDYYTGTAHTEITSLNFTFTIINFFRTFFQVHGLMFFVFKKGSIYVLPAMVSFLLVTYSFYSLSRFKLSSIFSISSRPVFYSQLIVLILHFSFAFYSVGNSEFMVMIPFQICILIACFITIKTIPVMAVSLAFLIWNFSYGVFPNYYYDFTGNRKLAVYAEKNPDCYFIFQNKEELESEVFYEERKTLYNLWPQPSHLELANTDTLTELITNACQNGKTIITDCYDNGTRFNRRGLIAGEANYLFFKNYTLTPFDSIETFYGKHKLYRITM